MSNSISKCDENSLILKGKESRKLWSKIDFLAQFILRDPVKINWCYLNPRSVLRSYKSIFLWVAFVNDVTKCWINFLMRSLSRFRVSFFIHIYSLNFRTQHKRDNWVENWIWFCWVLFCVRDLNLNCEACYSFLYPHTHLFVIIHFSIFSSLASTFYL